jgi:enoyl-CoA hydratase
MSDDILIKQDGPILRITLNRPEHGNGATDAMALKLTETLLNPGENTRLVVLTGNGKDFCVGRAGMGQRPAVDPEALVRRRFR